MPRRKSPPKLRLVVEYEMNRPDPEQISKEMAEEMHQALQVHIDRVVSKNMTYATGAGARLVRVTRMV